MLTPLMITPTPTPVSNNRLPLLPERYAKQRPMLVRIGIGLVGASLYALVDFASNGLPFALGVALFSVWGTSELYLAVRKQERGEPSDFLGFLACILFQYAAWTHNGARFAPYLPSLMMLLVIATLLTEMVKNNRPLINFGVTLLGAVYVGWLFSYLTLLHGLTMGGARAGIIAPPLPHTTPGEWMVVFVTASTWLSDSGALFVGRALGRHKMAPAISPNKTWEGSIGGILTSVVGGGLLGWWLHLPLGHALALAALCAMAGQVGDLCESVLKRDLGIKDFGSVLPEHGGILDRIDSLLFAAPLAYYYIVFFLMRHP